MKHFTKIMLILSCIIAISFDASAQYQTGDVFVAVSNGQVQWRQPDGTLVQTLNTGQGGFTTGMALDTGNNLYVTNFSASTVSKFDNSGNLIGLFGSGYSTPESIVFDNQSNVYVGNLGAGIRKFDYNGNFIATVGPNTDFFDLQADQCTALITHEGSAINRHNLCTNTPLSDFANGISGSAYALRIRTNGEVLLADGGVIRRFNSAGAEIQTYDATGENSWFALNLDPDGLTFWSADFSSSNVYRFDIATGAVVTSFNSGTGGSTVFGLAVAGEITVATQLFINLTPPDATNPINTQHCVTATVVDQFNVPQSGININFRVQGVNGVLNGSGQTNANGQTQYCYTGTAAGRDTIIANIGTTAQADTAFKTWTDDPLPVELSSFTSTVTNQDVTLNWSTASELNNAGFDIERSATEGQWTKVGNVQGNGTSNEVKNYQFTDRNLSSGSYSYRLKQIDFNGNFEYFNLSEEIIIGVPDQFSLSQNYPNPFNPTTKIDFQLPADGNVKISVFDNSGKLISEIVNGFKTAGYHTATFDGSNISSGIYFYKLESGNFSKVMKMTLVK